MPVEINEIVITATIAETASVGSANVHGIQQGMNNADIVKACVEEVLRVLKEKEER
ncbi:DUF5908 family protein [Niabella hibiscisoli]|uniref:DUF5908 family protein n=1 Tax=Niabella hibiscisoli TaxID=1825928 RepID=UPI001F108BCD|nr:DUF5908 family protein [Niabella hibiscisoli]MCH5716194.1 DUF5908 family protein [Niabella hibiscisoli]